MSIQLQNFVSLTTTGTSGASTLSNGVLNVPNYATGGTGFTTLYITTGDQSTTSNVASNITGLTISASANKRYLIFANIKLNGVAGGIKFQISAPTASTVVSNIFGVTNTGTAFASNGLNAINTLNTTYSFASANSINNFIQISGEVVTGANSGTIGIGFASGTNLNTSTIYQQGTFLQYLQI